MARRRKYNTEEEKKEAQKNYAKMYYNKHKEDPKFLNNRKYYYLKYRKGLSQSRKEFMRNYNTDYVYYIRNVITGKFEKKIAQTKEQARILNNKISSVHIAS